MKKTFSSLMSSFHGSCKSSSALPPPILYLSPKREADDGGCGARRMAAPAVVESRCRCVQREGRRRQRRSAAAIDIGEDDMSRARETPSYLWRKEEQWQVVSCSEEVEMVKVDEDVDQEEDEDEVPFAIMELSKSRTRETVLQQRRRERKNLIRSRSTISTSSCDNTCSSSEDEENDEREDSDEHEEDEDFGDIDTNALLSSLSLAPTANSSVGMPPKINRSVSPEPRTASASAVGMLKRLVPAASAEEGKVQESFAVVKKSEDPRGDFRRSMAEMVVEKGIYDASDLEQLLHCFLSLNSRHHHRAIVSAFSDIWQTLFPEDSLNFDRVDVLGHLADSLPGGLPQF